MYGKFVGLNSRKIYDFYVIIFMTNNFDRVLWVYGVKAGSFRRENACETGPSGAPRAMPMAWYPLPEVGISMEGGMIGEVPVEHGGVGQDVADSDEGTGPGL